MKFKEFKYNIEHLFNGKFDKSLCLCKVEDGIIRCIVINCLLAENLEECPHSIALNDMFGISLSIDLPYEWKISDDLPDDMTLEANHRRIRIKPKSDYMYCDMKQISFRKVSGDAEKLIAAFEKFINRLYNTVKTEYLNGNLLQDDCVLIKKKKYFEN